MHSDKSYQQLSNNHAIKRGRPTLVLYVSLQKCLASCVTHTHIDFVTLPLCYARLQRQLFQGSPYAQGGQYFWFTMQFLLPQCDLHFSMRTQLQAWAIRLILLIFSQVPSNLSGVRLIATWVTSSYRPPVRNACESYPSQTLVNY